MLHRARALDHTRLIEDNSPCHYNHVESDINSWHYYINDYRQVRRHIQHVSIKTYPGSDFNYVGGDYVQQAAPLINSEYGGIAARSGDQDIAWCFKYQTNELRRHDKICGYVYTELDDIEWEHNGFVNYDRSAKEFGYDHFVPGMTVADLNAADYVGLDAPPCQTLLPGATFSAPLFVSHWGPATEALRVRWELAFVDRFGISRSVEKGALDIAPRRFAVTDVGDLTVGLPNEPGLATMALHLQDGSGRVLCRNYVNVEISDGDLPAVEQIAQGWAVRFAPGVATATSWPQPRVDPAGDKFSATSSGWVEYEVALPAGVELSSAQRLRLRFEASARAGMAKVDWPERTYGFNYPQTEESKSPSDVQIVVNGVAVATVHLPDDPADARGVLSHHHEVDPGSYGYLAEVEITGDNLAQVAESVTAGGVTVRFVVPADGGFALYGATRGSVPVAPTLFIDL
ncbi:MAG: hypothetical protein HC802_05190 [Caldilineaceae bacterium]|nr:hypothetical protein [Caldilineaceae bacterium]